MHSVFPGTAPVAAATGFLLRGASDGLCPFLRHAAPRAEVTQRQPGDREPLDGLEEQVQAQPAPCHYVADCLSTVARSPRETGLRSL